MTLRDINQYGPGFQIKVLAALLNNKNFLVNIHDIVSEEYFDNQAHKWIMTEWCKQQFGDRWSVTDNRQGVWRCFWTRKLKSGEYDRSVYEWSFKNEKDAILFTLRWA